MIRRFFSFFRNVLFYTLLIAPLGWFAWGSFTVKRLLGDDNESSEAAQGTTGRSGSSSGHARFYHK